MAIGRLTKVSAVVIWAAICAVNEPARAAGPHVDVRWSVLAGQYFLAENLTAQEGGFDLEIHPGSEAEVMLRGVDLETSSSMSRHSSSTTGSSASPPSHEGLQTFEQRKRQVHVERRRERVSANEDDDEELEAANTTTTAEEDAEMARLEVLLPVADWTFKKLDVRGAVRDAARYRVTVQASSPHEKPMFRLGLTPGQDLRPGERLYREWMVDNRCLWYLAGRPDESAELNDDQVWGAFGQDGCVVGSTLSMEVDLTKGQVRFWSPSSQGSQPELRFSLDGFAPISLPRLTEQRDHVSLTQDLVINGASFNFETSNFGPDLPLGRAIVEGLVLADPIDACDPFSTRMSQKIKGNVLYALRGGCDFLDKVLHAQAAGAVAVIVADNKESRRQARPVKKSKLGAKGGDDESIAAGDLADGPELVIMDHINRHEDASRVLIPSVFVSNAADKYITSQYKAGRSINVALRGSVDAPAHHGLHWREHRLSPAIWLGPNTEVSITVEASPKASVQKQSCRPVAYLPLAASERKSLLASLRGVARSKETSKDAAGFRTSKRLAAQGQACGETEASPGSYLSVLDSGISLIPWLRNIPQFSSEFQESKFSARQKITNGWGLSLVPSTDLLRSQEDKSVVLQRHASRCPREASASRNELVVQRASDASDKSQTESAIICTFVHGLAAPRETSASILPVVSPEFFALSTLRAPLIYMWEFHLIIPEIFESTRQSKEQKGSETAESASGYEKNFEDKPSGKDNTLFAAVGVVTDPTGRASEFWGLTSDGFPLIKGREMSISSSSVEINQALRWTSYAGVLLDLSDMSITIFTDAAHSRWVTLQIKPNPDILLPVMGEPENGLPSAGAMPFITLHAGLRVRPGEFLTHKHADAVRAQKEHRKASSKCIQAHTDVHICAASASTA
mmetsp:Transcript_18817/g.36896  ORF Transcript_18817/g.36896 Transcript_18817/m.36896 type:complete len:912 (-) Transcript_18817:145-2880(-)